MEDNNLKDFESQNNPEVNMGAHDPKIDLVRNKNLFRKSLYTAGAFVLILIIVCTFKFCVSNNAGEEVSKAHFARFTATDSLSQANAMNMYKDIAQSSDATPAQIAKVFSARDAYEKGDYQQALDFIKDVNTKSPRVQTLKYCTEGDCYINLDKTAEAIEAFKKAVKEADENPELTPYALSKLANAYRFAADYKNEVETLRQLEYKYPAYNPQIEAEIARAEALAK